MNVADWLRTLGLEQYEALFRQNDIDAEVLPTLGADDLRELGVSSLGHRKKLLAAIAALGNGSSVATKVGATKSASASSSAERRQLTVMFCDLVGSTALSARLDPEDMSDLIRALQGAIAAAVARFDGHVAKLMGDGALIYFGYPRAHEDDAERAARAGLALVEAVWALGRERGVALDVRAGIATGLVVVGELMGEGEARERGVVGETPNLAARLQALAEPGQVVVAESTRRLLGGAFDLKALAPQSLKGFAVPISAWAIVREAENLSRFEASRPAAMTPFVGREQEVALLLERWRDAVEGEGQVVLLSGEAGIGKSRILAALRERIGSERHVALRYQCSPHHVNDAFYPIIGQIRRAAGLVADEPAATRVGKLEAMIALSGVEGKDTAPYLATLLSIPTEGRYPALEMAPSELKERTIAALIALFVGLTQGATTLALLEDAHWIDPTTLDVFSRLVEKLQGLRALMVVTFRPEFAAPWLSRAHVTALSLNRFGRRQAVTMIDRVTSGKALPAAVLEQIVAKTDGVPLFVEELTKTVLESGLLREENGAYILAAALTPLAIPSTLQDSLMARLDRLAPVKETAQIGAAIGREFSYRLLEAVSPISGPALQDALRQLTASELIHSRGTPPEASYVFKHALVQDTAYASLLRSRRQRIHADIARALAGRFADQVESAPAVIAHHYTEAGLVDESVAHWAKAGHSSAARSAMAEAAAQFQKGLDQLELRPDNPERQRQELEFYSALGAVLTTTKGSAAPETGHAFARARELWEKLGSPSEFLRVPFGQSRYHAFRGELDLAQRMDEDLLRLSRQRNESAGLVLGHLSSGRNLYYGGNLAASRSHLEAGLALYDPISHRSLVQQAALHPQVVSQSYLGIVLFCLGFPDQGLARCSAGIAEARRLAHPPTLATSLILGAVPLWLVEDNVALDERADQLVAVAAEQGFPYWHALGTIFRGWAKVKSGDVTEGTSLLRRGLSAYRATGAGVWIPYFIALLAGACEIAGQIEEGSILLDDALQIVERTRERWLAAELNRHKGWLLLRQGHSEAAEEFYRKALSIAEEQEAKLWELRSVTSLARLWRHESRRAEARALLAPIYGWFTEGLAMPDLQEAKALLDELYA